MIFSRKFKNFKEWESKFQGSEPYRQRIERLHSKYPDASLSQLRGHSGKAKPVSELKPEPIYKRSWSSITKRELNQRSKSLDVLRKVRHGESLKFTLKEMHTSAHTVQKNTHALMKVKGKWVVKSQDHISRVMSIYEKGKQSWIEVRDSRTASKIGKYNSAIGQFLENANKDFLKPFKKPFKDAHGKLHYFETDSDTIYGIIESQEEAEFWEIYRL